MKKEIRDSIHTKSQGVAKCKLLTGRQAILSFLDSLTQEEKDEYWKVIRKKQIRDFL